MHLYQRQTKREGEKTEKRRIIERIEIEEINQSREYECGRWNNKKIKSVDNVIAYLNSTASNEGYNKREEEKTNGCHVMRFTYWNELPFSIWGMEQSFSIQFESFFFVKIFFFLFALFLSCFFLQSHSMHKLTTGDALKTCNSVFIVNVFIRKYVLCIFVSVSRYTWCTRAYESPFIYPRIHPSTQTHTRCKRERERDTGFGRQQFISRVYLLYFEYQRELENGWIVTRFKTGIWMKHCDTRAHRLIIRNKFMQSLFFVLK